jgi:hypothetical protein
MQTLTQDEILRCLDLKEDNGFDYVFFPDFDNAYSYHVDQRLTAYGNRTRWVLVIEQVAVNPRGRGIETTLYFHGNAVVLPPQPGWGDRPVKSLYLIEDGANGPVFDLGDWVADGVSHVRIRGEAVPVRSDKEYYRARGIEVQVVSDADVAAFARAVRGKVSEDLLQRRLDLLRERVGVYRLETWHVARGLVPEYRELLLATEEERREGVPEDLPRLLQIDEWRHPRFTDAEVPSRTESFPRIAEVLATGDARAWRPAEKPNTHWKNWPDSGSL